MYKSEFPVDEREGPTAKPFEPVNFSSGFWYFTWAVCLGKP